MLGDDGESIESLYFKSQDKLYLRITKTTTRSEVLFVYNGRMPTNDRLAILQVVIAALGVLVVLMAWVEYGKVKNLRDEVHAMLIDLKEHTRRVQKAQQRIIASYGVKDMAQRLALIRSAIDADPDTFNGYNSLGYALMESGDLQAAVAAFIQATVRHPSAKEGWLDLAACHRQMNRDDLAGQCIAKAIEIDPTARDDVKNDSRLSGLYPE